MIRPGLIPSTPATWMGVEMAATPETWTRRWTDEQLDDLMKLAGGAADPDRLEIDLGAAASTTLPALADAIRTDLVHGHGFTLLTGLPVEEVDRRAIAAGFMILGRLVGNVRSQNAAGHLLGHVKDVGRDPSDPDARIYQTNGRQHFHTDSTDAVALLCLHPARSGGRSQLASAETVYRIFQERRPDLALSLFEPIATDRRGEVPEGADPWFEIPVLSWYDDRLTVMYQRAYVDSAGRFADAPRPTAEQIEALDLWDAILEEPDVHLTMDLEPGDVQFVYNHALLHDRTAFVDDPDPARRRHLLRLWLSLPGDRRLPPVFAQRYGSTTVGARGGVGFEGGAGVVPLDVA